MNVNDLLAEIEESYTAVEEATHLSFRWTGEFGRIRFMIDYAKTIEKPMTVVIDLIPYIQNRLNTVI